MNAVSHVAIGVRDMERSLHFYCDLLGLEVMSDQTQPIGNMPTPVRQTGNRQAPSRQLALRQRSWPWLFGFIGAAWRNTWRSNQAR